MHQQDKKQLLEKDRRYVWHPFTQMKDYANEDHLLIERAEGPLLIDADGNRYYDTISSWWTNIHGHGHPRIKEAVARQLESADHIMFSGLTHRPGIELAERLVDLAPAGLSRVFYSDNGSTAVEVALKMSFQYWRQSGHPGKTRFAYLDHSYHGDTIGSVSVGGVEQFHAMFKPLLFDAYKVSSPADLADWDGSLDDSLRSSGENAAGPEREPASTPGLHAWRNEVQALFEEHGDSIAAMIVEPLVQAAGGMKLYPPAYLRALRELCTRYRIHLIADEVAVGFGRTGRMFACEHAGVSPDLMCLSKGLTAGVMPLSATLATDDIYQAFYDDYAAMRTFFHGHSFTGNPIAAAVALESLNIFEDEGVLERTRRSALCLRGELSRFSDNPHVVGIRQLGLIAAFDLVADKTARLPFDWTRRTGFQVYKEGLKEGLLLRPLGDTIYYWLPLCVTDEQIRDIADRTASVLRRLGL